MATLWGFESLPGHQATLNADCPAPSIKTKTYTPGARQLHGQRKKLRLNFGPPRTTRVILSALPPFGSSHVTCGKPSLPPISSPFQTVQQRFACFLSGRRSRAAARQHCSTFCSIFPSMRVVHTRPCIALRGAVTVRAPKQCQSLCSPMPPPSAHCPSGTTHADSRHFGFPAPQIFAVSDFQHLPAHRKPVHRKPMDRKI